MSRNLQVEDIWSFMDPTAERRSGELTTVFVEHLKGIAAAPLPAREKALCYAVFLQTWTRRHIHVKRRLATLQAAVSGRGRRAA
jgi:hypothetical protein